MRRNPRYPEIPQLSKRAHISSFPPVSRGAEMTGDLCQVPLGDLTVNVQLRAELAHNPQIPAE